MWWLLGFAVLVVVYFIGRSSSASAPAPAPEPLTFGLEKARSARVRIANNTVATQAVLAMLEIMGIKNTVASEAAATVTRLEGDNRQFGDRISINEAEITKLQARIANLRLAIDENAASATEVEGLAEQFGG